MALKYKKDTYSYDGTFQLSSSSLIDKAEKRLTKKKEALEDMQNEYELIEKQTFETYCNNIHYLFLDNEECIQLSKQWLSMLKKNEDVNGNKLDRRKKYKEKEMYEFYIEKIKEYLGIEDITDISFIEFNFGQAIEVVFTYDNHKWALTIPHINNLRLKNYKDYGRSMFMLTLHHVNNVSWEWIGGTFEETELAELMTQGLNKYGGE